MKERNKNRMKNKKMNKVIYIFMIMILFIQNIFGVVEAATKISKADLKKDHKITTNLEFKHQDGTWHTVIGNYICYTNNGKKYPAYCIKHGVNGVDEAGNYTVNISKLLTDEKVWRTIINGYPYKTPEQLGVETEDDAYIATKQAINTVMLNRDVKNFYRGKNTKGEKIVEAIYNISEIGKNGTQTRKDANLKINKDTELLKYNDELYYQEYKVTSNVNISQYTINEISGFPEGSYITDEKGNKKHTFSSGEKFRVMIGEKYLDKDISGNINISGKCKTYPIFFGEAPRSNVQDYAVTYDAYGEFEANLKVIDKTNNASIKVVKQDKDTLEPIEGVKYKLSKENGEIISVKSTDKDGIIEFKNLYKGIYILQEIETDKNYIIDEKKYNLNLEYEQQFTKELNNEHKKGNLKILKVDKDDNDLTLGGIEFDLIDSKGKIVKHLITDADGEAVANDINIGNYTLKETKTKKEYKLSIDKDIIVKWNETSNIVIENEKQKGRIEIYKEDEENEQIKIPGVEFYVMDNKNNIVEKLITDSKGYAITSRLVVGDYYLKEIKTGKEYVLDTELKKIKIDNDKTTTVKITNRKKKGKISIRKTSSMESRFLGIKKGQNISGVVFNIYDSNGKIVDEITTDENGQAISKDLDIGRYKIKEKESNENYLMNEQEVIITIEKDGEIKIVNIENEPIIPKLKIEKRGPEQVCTNEEIEYEFDIRNNGNVEITDFTWIEYLPYEKTDIKKMSTGTYNENINYNIYYKTNKNDYKLLKTVNSQKDEYIDFDFIGLEKNEIVTEIKYEFGKVMAGFKNNTKPKIIVKSKDKLKNGEIIENNTELTGKFKEQTIKDIANVKTILKEIQIAKKLPRTGK